MAKIRTDSRSKIRGPVRYKVLLQDGRVIKRHVDQIRPRTVNNDVSYPLRHAI